MLLLIFQCVNILVNLCISYFGFVNVWYKDMNLSMSTACDAYYAIFMMPVIFGVIHE